MLNLARFQLRRYFHSPLAWSLAAVVMFLLGWLFLVQVERFVRLQPQLPNLAQPPGLTDLVVVPLLQSASMLLMLVIPLLSMRLLSEEYRSGTITLLLSAPLPLHRLLLGKYLGLLGLLGFLWLLVGLMPLSLLLGGTLDLGRLAAGMLGLALQLAAFGAIGLLMSTLNREPTLAAVSCYGVLLALATLDLAPAMRSGGGLFHYLASNSHFSRLLSGMVHGSDIIYYLLLILGSLALALHRLEVRRCEG